MAVLTYLKKPLLIIFFVAIIIRLFYIISVGNDLFFNSFADAGIYSLEATNIVNGVQSQEPFFWPPLYPYLMAFFYKIFGSSYLSILIFQGFIDALCCIFIYYLGRKLFNKKIAIIASLFYAVYIPAIFYSGFISPDAVVPFLTLLFIITITLAIEKHSVIIFFISGIILGIQALTRTNCLLFVPVFFVITIVLKKSMKHFLFLAVGTLFAILPTTIRNYKVADDFVLISYNLGINFYLGNNPEANATYFKPNNYDISNDFTGKKTAEFVNGTKLKASQTSSFWIKKGLDFLKDYPTHALGLYIKKAIYFWSAYEIPQAESLYYAAQYFLYFHIPIFSFGFLGPLSILGLIFILFKRKYWKNFGLVTNAFYICSIFVSYMPFFIIGRFRHAVSPLLILFAVFFAFEFLSMYKAKSIRKITISVIIIIILYITIFLINPRSTKDSLCEAKTHLGIWHINAGEYDDALRVLNEVVEKNEKCSDAHANIGNVYFWNGLYELATKEYRKAIEYNPKKVEYYKNLGTIYYYQAEIDSALKYYKIAKDMAPLFVSIYNKIQEAEQMFEFKMKQPYYYYFVLAEQLMDLGNYPQAIIWYEKSTELNYVPTTVNKLSIAYFASGDYQKSIHLLAEAIEIYPQDIELLNNLGYIYYKTGDSNKAHYYWRRSLALEPDQPWLEKKLQTIKF
ncbi:hypothetical protein AMJ52_01305 [candidate division TA06 bacterium DG_78]|uniref:Glycosyltransferase RgtA/B/C/D-like domain-containing protein n=1 Tax=candidate division TA06 bacterium DG_78 TaxID=1703772 RepID=A0A0S7YHJ9_UNCT6|nr:MAG: hypothetical protein AMJ52_01305 [candidate division TA06 bacterium DG_78]